MSQIYAMDTFFTTSLGTYTLPNRCQILSELGYDGTHLTIWDARTAATIPQSAPRSRSADVAWCSTLPAAQEVDACECHGWN